MQRQGVDQYVSQGADDAAGAHQAWTPIVFQPRWFVYGWSCLLSSISQSFNHPDELIPAGYPHSITPPGWYSLFFLNGVVGKTG